MINLEPHPTDPDKLIIKTQKYHFAKYTEEDLQAAIAAENEACAKVCEVEASAIVTNASEQFQEGRAMGATVCAAAIRERMK